MINADEHKKLLEQINELERNSINYFDVEQEFFLITSDNLHTVRPKLYGYSIQATGIYENDNLTPEAVKGLDGRGAYVYVGVKDDKITIKQDINGCWGIYLFRHGDYFALSNSFFRLVDHVKFKYPLTVNRDYCHNLLTIDIASWSYSETAVNEIKNIPREAIIHINISKETLDLELIDYKERTLSLDSAEGMETLDKWVDLWANVLRGIAYHTKFLMTTLSGGFDSRVSLSLLLNSGIDLKKLRIYSIKDDFHTHREDYAIASQIAAHYGFELNRSLPESQVLSGSLSDTFNLSLNVGSTFTLLPRFRSQKRVDKLYLFDGSGGEGLRSYYHESQSKFIEHKKAVTNPFPSDLSCELFHSIETILKSGFHLVCSKYNIKEEEAPYIPQLLYIEGRLRTHFGKDIASNSLMNTFMLSPAMDPIVRILKLETPECKDSNLLVAMLFTRYAPDLLSFPFESNRSIKPETIEYAKKLNERFPRCLTTDDVDGGGDYHLSPRDLQVEKILALGQNNELPPYNPVDYLKAIFESSWTYGLFTSYFDRELYHWAASYYEEHVFGRERPMYGVISIAKVIEDVTINQRNSPIHDGMKHFLEQDFTTIRKDKKMPDKFKDYLTARIDIKLMTTEGDFQILAKSDEKAAVTRPRWFQGGGVGYVIESFKGELTFTGKATVDGKIKLSLKGIWLPKPEDRTKLIPYWIDYTRLTVNDKMIFDKLTPAWHNKPYRYNMDVKAGEELKIQVEWLPHRSDT